jgi:hypothetical protein
VTPEYVTVREIDKMGRKAVDSNELFIDDLPVPVEDRIGEEGRGLEYIFHGMNAERVFVAAEANSHVAKGPGPDHWVVASASVLLFAARDAAAELLR